VELLGETKIEIRKVDEYCSVRLAPFRLAHHFAEAAVDSRKMFDHFSQADDSYLPRINNQIASCAVHLLSADAKEFKWRVVAALGSLVTQGFHKLRAVGFARSFSGRDEDSHERIMTGVVLSYPLSAVGLWPSWTVGRAALLLERSAFLRCTSSKFPARGKIGRALAIKAAWRRPRPRFQ